MKKENVDIYTKESLSHKKNSMLLLTTAWMKLELIMLSKMTQAQECKYPMSYKYLQKIRVQWKFTRR